MLYGVEKRSVPVKYRNRYGKVRTYDTTYSGIVDWLERKRNEADGDWSREQAEQFMREVECTTCRGQRLKPEVLAVMVHDRNIAEVNSMTIDETIDLFRHAEAHRARGDDRAPGREGDRRAAHVPDGRGTRLPDAWRASATLSGGEAQRIRLASQIGSYLVGVLYVLDEPSIGLHQRDNRRLIATLERLRDLGNSVIVVEHDEETIRLADFIVDIGPGAGEFGGRVVHAGTYKELLENTESLTGQYLSGEKSIADPRDAANGRRQEAHHQGRAGEQPTEPRRSTCPSGTSSPSPACRGRASPRSINGILLASLEHQINRAKTTPMEHDTITGVANIDKVVAVDQQPIGRTPRSNPATYTGVFDKIRKLFAETQEAKVRGYQQGRFSFNVKGGRCETCAGDGTIKIEMHFLPDVYVNCEVVQRRALQPRDARDQLPRQVDRRRAEHADHRGPGVLRTPAGILRHIQSLSDVGLGYVRLGQPAPTLSGGEAQRVKLATELARRPTGHTLYVLDEPTTGLHFEDVKRLLQVLHRLVDQGNTVLVIEHNLDVVKTADWVIDLGPEGGRRGGTIVGEGTPEEIATLATATGLVLKESLAAHGRL